MNFTDPRLKSHNSARRNPIFILNKENVHKYILRSVRSEIKFRGTFGTIRGTITVGVGGKLRTWKCS